MEYNERAITIVALACFRRTALNARSHPRLRCRAMVYVSVTKATSIIGPAVAAIKLDMKIDVHDACSRRDPAKIKICESYHVQQSLVEPGENHVRHQADLSSV